MPVQEVPDSASFNKHLITAKSKGQLVVVDFYATWCGPCKAIAPAVEALSSKYPHIVFLKVDVDKVGDVAREAGVTAMPTFCFYLDGRVVETVKGADARAIEAHCVKHGKPVKNVFEGQGYTLSGGKPAAASQSTATAASGSAPARRNPWADASFVESRLGKKPAATATPSQSTSQSTSQPSKPTPTPSQPTNQSTPAPAKPVTQPASQPAAQPTPASTAPAAAPTTAPPTTASGRVHDSKLKINDVMLAELLSMGFTQVRAEKSLILTQNKSSDAALEWLMEHQEDADIDEPLQVVGQAVGQPANQPNLDDMDEDERLIYEEMMKKKAATASAGQSSSQSSSQSANQPSGQKAVAEMTSAEKMAWLAAKRAEVKAKREQEALDKVKTDFKSQKGMTSALNDLKEQREEHERKMAMERKKKEQMDKAKQRREIAERLAADKERRRIEQQRTMEALQKAKEAKGNQ